MYEYVEKATRHLTAKQLTDFSRLYRKRSKKEKVAYFWGIILGAFGGHRFYVGHYGTGLILLSITVFTLGLGAVAGWYDVLNVPRIVERENKDIILNTVKEVRWK